MKKYFLPIICLTAINMYAQQEVKGTIQYSNQTPIALADVIIFQDDKIIDELSTNENGLFTTTLENGTYVLKVEESGQLLHSQQIIIQDNQEIGLIIVPLKETEITLNETVVTGQKKMIEKKVDRLIFNVDQAEGAKGGNALDALKLAPRIKVDENTDAISIIGKGSVTVMIDDRLMQMSSDQLANYLKTIRAEDIEKIEIITNPSAKYDATGNSGIINIVLKSAKAESLNGSLSSTYNQQKYPGYNLNGNINFRKDKWTVTANIYNGSGSWYNKSKGRIYYTDETWISDGFNKNENTYIGGKVGVDYQINNKLITGFNLNLSKGDGTYDNFETTGIYKINENQPSRYITSDRNGSDWDWSYVGLNYHIIKKFDTDGKKLTFDFDYSNNPFSETSKTISREYNSVWEEITDKYQDNITYTDQKSNRYNVSLDMEHPVNSWKMNYGTRLRWAKDDAENNRYAKTNKKDDKYNDGFQYNENIFALYYSIEKQFAEKWTAKAGLRYEHAKVEGLIKKEDFEYSKTFEGLYPTAYLMYQAAENHSFTFNYSRRVERPFIWYLNPFEIKGNDYNISVGNPDLTPSNSNNFELEYAYKDLTVTSIYYKNSNDIFEQVNIYDPETKINTEKPFNIGKSYSFGLSENLNIKPKKWWKLNASADVFYSKTKSSIPEMKDVDGLNGEFRITNNLDLNKKKTLFANYSFNYYAKSYDNLQTTGDFMRHNIGFRAMIFDKKLQLSLNISNLFANKNPYYSTISNDVKNINEYSAYRMFRVGITYNFGKQFNIETSKSNQEQGGGKG
ncbi:TonB-dependent receptor domain-containing protein [Empedobacter brevis]|uniref:TonB-dependent receptor domain-containing protein n=1 Tax=Empedobacter brevis TaxID=247 RepID=UPI0039AEF629